MLEVYLEEVVESQEGGTDENINSASSSEGEITPTSALPPTDGGIVLCGFDGHYSNSEIIRVDKEHSPPPLPTSAILAAQESARRADVREFCALRRRMRSHTDPVTPMRAIFTKCHVDFGPPSSLV
ncbi:hypothetical protein MN608_03949 [Microdochium nivale]|nr:hypothetical protein MN608_03949 [Microdochium nivale]